MFRDQGQRSTVDPDDDDAITSYEMIADLLATSSEEEIPKRRPGGSFPGKSVNIDRAHEETTAKLHRITSARTLPSTPRRFGGVVKSLRPYFRKCLTR